MSYRYTLRVKTRMSAEALEKLLERTCKALHTFRLDGIEERNGEAFKVMTLAFVFLGDDISAGELKEYLFSSGDIVAKEHEATDKV